MYMQNSKYQKQSHSYVHHQTTNVIIGSLLVLLLSIYSDSIRSLIPTKTISFFLLKTYIINI